MKKKCPKCGKEDSFNTTFVTVLWENVPDIIYAALVSIQLLLLFYIHEKW